MSELSGMHLPKLRLRERRHPVMVDVKSRATDMWALFEAIDQCEPDVEKQVLTS